ncbi:MAG TPA: LCP family protein [Candidatus Onthovicinus excrementipullorum]|nr:LCP family protein [Candidatus Onthovicinus excrementipullorum]
MKGFGKKGGLRFETKARTQSRKRLYFIAGFLAFLLVFGSIAAVMMYRMYQENGGSFFGPVESTEPESVTGEADSVEYILPEVSGKENFLIACTPDDYSYVEFLVLVCVDMDQITAHVCPLSPSDTAEVQGISRTLSDHYLYAGGRQLQQAVAALGGIPVDRYAIVTYSNFKKVFGLFGKSVEVDLTQAVAYECDTYSISLPAGTQSINADTALKLMRAPVSNAGENRAKVMCAMFDTFLTEKNIVQGSELFAQVMDLIDTNITANDYAAWTNALTVLARSGDRKPADWVQSLTDAVFQH